MSKVYNYWYDDAELAAQKDFRDRFEATYFGGAVIPRPKFKDYVNSLKQGKKKRANKPKVEKKTKTLSITPGAGIFSQIKL